MAAPRRRSSCCRRGSVSRAHQARQFLFGQRLLFKERFGAALQHRAPLTQDCGRLEERAPDQIADRAIDLARRLLAVAALEPRLKLGPAEEGRTRTLVRNIA